VRVPGQAGDDDCGDRRIVRSQMAAAGKEIMNDDNLKLALAKMLPEKIIIAGGVNVPRWKAEQSQWRILDTEWLHVCWLVEQGLSIRLPAIPHQESERTRYVDLLNEACGSKGCCIATWQQRAQALCKVKGIEV